MSTEPSGSAELSTPVMVPMFLPSHSAHMVPLVAVGVDVTHSWAECHEPSVGTVTVVMLGELPQSLRIHSKPLLSTYSRAMSLPVLLKTRISDVCAVALLVSYDVNETHSWMQTV